MRAVILLMALAAQAQAGTVTNSFTVAAVVTSGCVAGSSSSASGDYGTINFGEMVTVDSNVDMVSSSGAGSIIVTCTPGTALSIALDAGLHGADSSSRSLSNGDGTATLSYQLYQDAGFSSVWGSGTEAYSIAAFPATTQTLPVYARLFATTTRPAAGTYTDTVTVTLTW